MIRLKTLQQNHSGRMAMKRLENHNLQFFDQNITKKTIEVHEINRIPREK